MLSFDRWLTIYTLSGFLLALVFSLLFVKTILSGKSMDRRGDWMWGIAFFAVLLFMRYPFIAYNREMDIDESQMLAQALSLKHYWIYWKYVDGLTQGPLASYCLIIPTWLGMPFDYTSARLLGYIFLCLTLFASYKTFRNLFSLPAALLAFAPAAFFYLLSQGSFSTLYNEYVCLCLLALCFWLFAVLYRQRRPGLNHLFLLGFLAGMVPFAKLQGTPTALLIVAFAGMIILARSPRRTVALTVLVAGGLLFPLLVTLLAVKFGGIDQLWKFYVLGNAKYSSGATIWEKALNYATFLRRSGQFLYLVIGYGMLIAFAGIMLTRGGKRRWSADLLFWFGLLNVLAAFYAIIKSGYTFPHYQQFAIIPLGLLAGSLLDHALHDAAWNAWRITSVCMVWLVILFFPHLAGKLAATGGYSSKIYTQINHTDLGKPLVISPVSRQIMRYTRPGDAITIWGWYPSYHLETGLPQGTGDVICYRILTPAPDRQNYQLKYLSDLKSRRPTVLVDEVNPGSFWFRDTTRYRHEHIRAIGDFIAQNYRYVSTVDGQRIYVYKTNKKAHQL